MKKPNYYCFGNSHSVLKPFQPLVLSNALSVNENDFLVVTANPVFAINAS
jgi:hypothetical protein